MLEVLGVALGRETDMKHRVCLHESGLLRVVALREFDHDGETIRGAGEIQIHIEEKCADAMGDVSWRPAPERRNVALLSMAKEQAAGRLATLAHGPEYRKDMVEWGSHGANLERSDE